MNSKMTNAVSLYFKQPSHIEGGSLRRDEMLNTATLDTVSDLVAIIGTENFEARFLEIFDDLIGADQCTVFLAAHQGVTPLVATAQSPYACKTVRRLAQTYAQKGYVDDPVWNDDFHARIIAPQDFDERYRQEFYDKPNILEEIAVCAVTPHGRVYASFYRERRSERTRFRNDEVDALRAVAGITLQVLSKHAEFMTLHRAATPSVAPLDREALFAKVRTAIQSENSKLTNREAEICAGIVMGYTILGLSLNLGISVNTIATHRKRAYAKLQISSQNELFAHYFGLVEAMQGRMN